MQSNETIKKNINNLIKFCKKKEMIELKNDNIDEYKQKIMQKFPIFHSTYPTLFFMIIEDPDKLDYCRLNELLEYKKKIEENRMTYDDASKELGQKYYDEFVKPNL